MALPLASERPRLPLTVAFIATSLLVALTAGSGLGGWLLLHITLGVPVPDGGWTALVQLHGHAQLVGFAVLLVMGIGYRILPRFRGADEPAPGLMAASFGLVTVGLVLRFAQVLPELSAREPLLLLSGTLTVAGTLLYAHAAVEVLGAGESPRRADEAVLGAAIVWTPIGALWSLISLGPLAAGFPAADAAASSAAIWALLLGSIGGHILGVSLRVAPAFIAAPVAPTRLVLAGAAAWNAGVVGMTLELGLAPLFLLAGALALVYAVGPFRRTAAVRPLPPPARITRAGFRAAYAWLIGALALLTLASAAPFGGSLNAARHAIALGFLMSMVFAVGARLIPALTGGLALPAPAVVLALALTNAAAILRVAFELIGWTGTASSIGLAASGALGYAALVTFVLAALRTVRSALGAAV
ncbi:MAG TPA: NnrS family protein [Candidatus Limnocylindrales bacterium]|nr:NnrS family protein [Candidatus Limnocylindrales bacterium]